jgi:hypothetical protein
MYSMKCVLLLAIELSILRKKGSKISMGTNVASLLPDLFLCLYESEFLQNIVKDKKIHEARAFNFTYRYIDDVLSIKGDTYVIDEELRHTDHIFLGVACFTFLNFV